MSDRNVVIKHAVAEYRWERERGERLCSAVGFVNCELAQRRLPTLTRDEREALLIGTYGTTESDDSEPIVVAECT